MRTLAVGLVLGMALAACGGPPVAGCTEIGCINELAIEVGLDGVTDGITVVASLDGRTITCTVPGVDDSDGVLGGCDDPSTALEHAVDGETRLATLRIGGLIEGGPVTVVVSDGSGDLARVTETPEYETSQPNGPGCPPVCRVGTLAVQAGR